ncbi:MAG: hypothetical protein Q8M66_04600, partial [Actinomycetota bacterium]|nr:hypothetical protein [Actinomycetota bacterium]
PQHQADEQSERERSSARKFVLLAILLLLLALLLYATYYYMNNRRLPIPRIGTGIEAVVAPPEYVFSISGPAGPDALTRPVGVAIIGDRMYATDTRARTVRAYTLDGSYLFSFSAVADGGATTLGNPQHVSAGPDGNLYVSDRRLRAVFVFTPEGEYVRKIAPDDEDGLLWSPLGTTFDAGGNLWATDVGITDKHRIIVFDPDGEEIRRFGSTGQANQMSDLPGSFYFPNGIVFSDDGRLFIGDSNNRRVQVYGSDGAFDYFIRTSGIPRGMVIDEKDRLYVVDALAHTVDIYTLEGDRITSFGGSGIGPGEFAYANAVDLDAAGRIYVTDRENHQVQVWEWPDDSFVLPAPPSTPWQWALCLSPLALLPLLLLFRRRRYAVTGDFVEEMAALGKVGVMDKRRIVWLVPEHLHERYIGRVEDDVDLGELIRAQAFSDSDARDLAAKREVTYDDAALLVLAKRAKHLCTEDVRIGSLARRLDINVLNAEEFLRRYDKHGEQG